jgi:hypothetical protein
MDHEWGARRLMGKRFRRTSMLALLPAAAIIVLLAASGEAVAYPQFQFSSGTTRCGQCHYSPSGGGLISAWGRDESAETISLGGDGAPLNGLLPRSWLGIGADVRLAALRNDVGGPDAPEVAFFPMQLDLYGRLEVDAFSAYVSLGDRGIVRPVDPSVSGRASQVIAELASREHYLMWRPSATGPYVRAGRFSAPYGLRFVEHVFFVQRYTGFDLYEETYNASGGYVAEDWELHLTAFAHVPRRLADLVAAAGPPENGGVAYVERRLASIAALALQSRVGVAPEEARYQLGAVGKLWVERARVLLLGEADFIRQQLRTAGTGQNQFVSYVGATYFMRGLMVGVAYERFQEDLAVAGTGRNAYDAELNLFPWSHFEVVLFGRYQNADAGPRPATPNAAASLLMLQLHYYL